MAAPGIKLNGSVITTEPIQNVAGVNSTIGFFFLNGWSTHPGTSIEFVRPGWTVVGEPTWVVSAVDPGTETITITGGTFLDGSSYQFTGTGGFAISGGVTFTA